MSTSHKYRPYLSLHQIELITTLLLSHAPEESDLIKSLQLISLKAGNGITSPAYTSRTRAPSKYSAEGLGLASPLASDSRKSAYLRWVDSPNMLTKTELEEANSYRYENDLMSKEEMEQWEKSLGL